MSTLEKGKPLVEEYVICLTRIMEAVKAGTTDLAKGLRSILKSRFLEVLRPLTLKEPSLVGISPRNRFLLMNIVDLINSF
jgi:hypothetical protein